MNWLFEKLNARRARPVETSGVSRDAMETVIKTDCVPALRELGFKGSFPNFYREDNGFTALVNFQFYSAGGSFCVNLSYADPDHENVTYAADKGKPAKKLRVSSTRDRRRLGGAGGDKWFSFGPTSYKRFRGDPVSAEAIVSECNRLFVDDAEPWWRTKQEN